MDSLFTEGGLDAENVRAGQGDSEVEGGIAVKTQFVEEENVVTVAAGE